MSWPEQMPQPPEGTYWKIGSTPAPGMSRRLKLKRGLRTISWTVLDVPKGSQVEDVDAEVVWSAHYILNKIDISSLADRQHARLDGYGKWE